MTDVAALDAPSPVTRRGPAVVSSDDGPHVRLGLVWAAIVVAASLAGTWWLGAWMAVVAGLAGVQASRSWRTAAARGPQAVLAGAGAAVIALAAAGGERVLGLMAAIVALAVVSAGVAAGAVRAARHIRRSSGHIRTTVIAVAIGLAGAAPVLARRRGLAEGLVLLAMWCSYDAATYLVGTGAATSWEGPAAGIATIAALSLGVAAVVDPPFQGATPWILGGVACLTAPFGRAVASRLLRGADARAPALRRLDSLILLGPAWAVTAALVLR
jgi:hypothetical protein